MSSIPSLSNIQSNTQHKVAGTLRCAVRTQHKVAGTLRCAVRQGTIELD
ncbi:MAG: hypothetical protein ACK449_08850 [Planctomycetota bacterium]